jgi:hypothetical protein
LAALAVVWFVPSDNLAVGRYAVEEYLSRSKPIDQRPLEMQARLDRRERSDELRALCRWLADTTPIDSVIACTDGRVRLWARRAVLACRGDEPYFTAAPTAQRTRWLAALAHQARTLRPSHGGPVDLAALARFGEQYGASYIILSAQTAPPDVGTGPRMIKSAGRWGVHWTLWKVDRRAEPLPATSAAPS